MRESLDYAPEKQDELEGQETAETCDPGHIQNSSDTDLH